MSSTRSAAGPSLGLAVPTYRRQDQLQQLLASIPADVEVYVSDNGATLSSEFIQQHAHVHFRSFPETVPMFPNWNRAARMAETDWVMVPSDDDIYYPHSFEAIRRALEQHPEAEVVIFGHHDVDEYYRVLSTWCPPALRSCPAPEGFEPFAYGVLARMPSIAFRRSALVALDYFDERFRITASDSDLVQRALIRGHAVYVPQVVSGYRTWPGGATSQTIATQDWLDDIKYWGGKIEQLLLQQPRFAAQAARIRSELYALNLLAGVARLRQQGEAAKAWAHFRRSTYPHGATWGTQLRLFYQLLRPARPAAAAATRQRSAP
jgi:GT2 family glycosyltransferase